PGRPRTPPPASPLTRGRGPSIHTSGPIFFLGEDFRVPALAPRRPPAPALRPSIRRPAAGASAGRGPAVADHPASAPTAQCFTQATSRVSADQPQPNWPEPLTLRGLRAGGNALLC